MEPSKTNKKGKATGGSCMSYDMSNNCTAVADSYRLRSNGNDVSTSSVARASATWHKKRRTMECDPFDDSSDEEPVHRTRGRRPRRSPRNLASVSTDRTLQVDKKRAVSYTDIISTIDQPKKSRNNSDKIQLKTVETNTEIASPSKSVEDTPSEVINNIATLGFVTPLPPFSQQPTCVHCGNKGYACHNYMYSGYCTKACFHYLQHNTIGWEAGFDTGTMEKVFKTAYNEKRRVELEERHGYYSHVWVEVPKCMKLKSLRHAVLLGDNPQLCDDLAKHNKAGHNKYLEAKRNFKG